MKKLQINKIPSSISSELNRLSKYMDEVSEKHQISIMNWPGYSDEPEVSFKIAYTSQELIIKYEVTEYYVMAQYTESNQSVFQDSCVEFFVTPITEGPYYNFEFNAIGTCLMQTGLARHDREPGDNDVIKRIILTVLVFICKIMKHHGNSNTMALLQRINKIFKNRPQFQPFVFRESNFPA